MTSVPNNKASLKTRGIRVAKAEIGLISNNLSLITAPEYFEGSPHPSVIKGEGWLIHSQWANFQVHTADYQPPPNLDGYFYILDYKNVEPTISISEDKVVAIGNWSALEENTADKRYTLLGNQGLLFRFILTILERKHGIYNLHASALYNEESDELLIALGERGSGKSALMLSALDKGLFKLFATEILHVGMNSEGITFYKGTTRNNVRVGHLLYDFPGIAAKIGVKFAELQDPWGTKVQVNLKYYEAKPDILINPKVTLVIPRIEEYNEKCQYHFIKSKHTIKRILMENICDKIGSLTLLYETIPVNLDDPILIKKRLAFIGKLVDKEIIERAVSIFASPRNCFEGWL